MSKRSALSGSPRLSWFGPGRALRQRQQRLRFAKHSFEIQDHLLGSPNGAMPLRTYQKLEAQRLERSVQSPPATTKDSMHRVWRTLPSKVRNDVVTYYGLMLMRSLWADTSWRQAPTQKSERSKITARNKALAELLANDPAHLMPLTNPLVVENTHATWDGLAGMKAPVLDTPDHGSADTYSPFVKAYELLAPNGVAADDFGSGVHIVLDRRLVAHAYPIEEDGHFGLLGQLPVHAVVAIVVDAATAKSSRDISALKRTIWRSQVYVPILGPNGCNLFSFEQYSRPDQKEFWPLWKHSSAWLMKLFG